MGESRKTLVGADLPTLVAAEEKEEEKIGVNQHSGCAAGRKCIAGVSHISGGDQSSDLDGGLILPCPIEATLYSRFATPAMIWTGEKWGAGKLSVISQNSRSSEISISSRRSCGAGTCNTSAK